MKILIRAFLLLIIIFSACSLFLYGNITTRTAVAKSVNPKKASRVRLINTSSDLVVIHGAGKIGGKSPFWNTSSFSKSMDLGASYPPLQYYAASDDSDSDYTAYDADFYSNYALVPASENAKSNPFTTRATGGFLTETLNSYTGSQATEKTGTGLVAVPNNYTGTQSTEKTGGNDTGNITMKMNSSSEQQKYASSASGMLDNYSSGQSKDKLEFEFGRDVINGLGTGKFSIDMSAPSALIVSPQGLKYSSRPSDFILLSYGVDTTVADNTDLDIPAGIAIVEMFGKQVTFKFGKNSPIGLPSGELLGELYKMELCDADGNPVTNASQINHYKLFYESMVLTYTEPGKTASTIKFKDGRILNFNSQNTDIAIAGDIDNKYANAAFHLWIYQTQHVGGVWVNTVTVNGSEYWHWYENHGWSNGTSSCYPVDSNMQEMVQEPMDLKTAFAWVFEFPDGVMLFDGICVDTDYPFNCYGTAGNYTVTNGVVSYTPGAGEIFYNQTTPRGLYRPNTSCYNTLGLVKQYYSKEDGLANIVKISNSKYEIRYHKSADVGERVDGVYNFSGTPYKTITIENISSDPASYDNIRFTEKYGDRTYIATWLYDEASGGWRITDSLGRVFSTVQAFNDSRTLLYETRTLQDSSGTTVSKKTETYKYFTGNVAKLTENIVAPNELNLTTTLAYYTTSSDTARYLKEKYRQNPDGSWVSYTYDDQGRVSVMVEAWCDTALNTAAASAKATYYYYVPLDANDTNSDIVDNRPRTIETKVLGKTVRKIFKVYYQDADGRQVEVTEEAASSSASYGSSGNLKTVRTYYPNSDTEAWGGRLYKEEFPAGRMNTYTYQFGTYTHSSDPVSCSFTAATGDRAFRTEITAGTTSSPDGIAGKSLKTVFIINENGNLVLTEKWAMISSGTWEKIDCTANTYDGEHHLLSSTHLNGLQNTHEWSSGTEIYEKTNTGTEYYYTYDLAKRLTGKTKSGTTGQQDISVTYAYDADDRPLSETISSGGLSSVSAYEYDLSGRVTRKTSNNGLLTSYSYENGGRKITETIPGAFTRIAESYLDGRIKSLTGTSAVGEYYTYGAETDGSAWTQINYSSSSSSMYYKSWTDLFGRLFKSENPGFNGTISRQSFYNSNGQLVKTTATGLSSILYSYDELGNLYRKCIDVNANDGIDLASMDRIAELETVYLTENGGVWKKTTQNIYGEDNSANSLTTAIHKKRMTGFSGTVSEIVDTDIYGNINTFTTQVDSASKNFVITNTSPASSQAETLVFSNDLPASYTNFSNVNFTYNHDSIARYIGENDPRSGTSIIHYDSNSFVDYIQNSAGTKKYYSYDNAGRKISETDYSGVTKTFSYNSRGQITSVNGDISNPVDCEYDDYGKLTKTKIYKNQNAENPEIVTYLYDNATGLLTSKTYDGKILSYEYTLNGKISKRKWCRSVTTNYAYNTLNELEEIDYSDTTNDVSLAYTRTGQLKAVTDALGTRTFGYNSNFQLASETINGIYSKVLARNYTASGFIGRYTGLNIGEEYSTAYDYDTYGRFNKISFGSDIFDFAYLANSDLLSSIIGQNGVSSLYNYETNLNLVASMENKYNLNGISQFDYQNESYKHRLSMTETASNLNALKCFSEKYSYLIPALDIYNQSYVYTCDYTNNNFAREVQSANSGSIPSSLNPAYTITPAPRADLSSSATYDDDGNMLTDGTWTYTWDAENRMSKAEKDGVKLEFLYDYLNRRFSKKTYNGETLTKDEKFVYDADKIIEKLDGTDSNALKQKYFWAGEFLIAVTEQAIASSYYYMHDGDNSIVSMVDASGNTIASYEYSESGKIKYYDGSYSLSNPFRFLSKYFDDETSLICFGSRYYNPESITWLGENPALEEAASAVSSTLTSITQSYSDMTTASSSYSADNAGELDFDYNIQFTYANGYYFKELVVENAEDGDTYGWTAVGSSLSSNIADTENSSNHALKITSDNTDSGFKYILPAASDYPFIEWRAKSDEQFQVYVICQTSDGQRTLCYNSDDTDIFSGTGETITHGLGVSSVNGKWHTFRRNILTDIADTQPSLRYDKVLAVMVKGTACIDDIKMLTYTDSDGDTIPDELETALGLAPDNNADAKLDLDSDGLLNFEEVAYRTRLNSSDSDSDGLPDYYEVSRSSTNPAKADSNGNTTGDKDEDTDIDLYQNSKEMEYGTDPLKTTEYANSYHFNQALIENCLDETTGRWAISGNTSGALVENIADIGNSSGRAFRFTGAGTDTAFRYDFPKVSDYNIIEWHMKYISDFTVSVLCRTSAGPRLLVYGPEASDSLGDAGTIHHGLGVISTCGQWRTFRRNLQADISDAQPSVRLFAVTAFIVNGSAYLGNLRMLLYKDTDGDTVPDELETKLGLDPDDRADGALDLDGDGLSNTEEVAYGTLLSTVDYDEDGLYDGSEVNRSFTNPLLADSDGDTVNDADEDPDGDELNNLAEQQYGTDPLSTTSYANSYHFNQTIIENAEDANTTGWTIGGVTDGALIENLIDPTDASNRVMKFTGSGVNTSFTYTFPQVSYYNIIEWRMNYAEAFEIQVTCQTTAGLRYMKYDNSDTDSLGAGDTVHHGLGASSINGKWRNFRRSLQEDLNEAQPGVRVIAVTAFIIKGSGYLDDLRMLLYKDTDGDTLPDELELALGLDPYNKADGAADLDFDGLSNAAELAYGTDLSNPDTDGDGVLDGDEVSSGTNPKSSALEDTDSDGLPDSWEIQYFNNLSQGPTDDPDSDTYLNNLEYYMGMNPTVPFEFDTTESLGLELYDVQVD